MTINRVNIVLVSIGLALSLIDVVLFPRHTAWSWAIVIVSRGALVWALVQMIRRERSSH